MIQYFGEGLNNFWVTVQKNKAVENCWLLFRLTATPQVIHVAYAVQFWGLKNGVTWCVVLVGLPIVVSCGKVSLITDN